MTLAATANTTPMGTSGATDALTSTIVEMPRVVAETWAFMTAESQDRPLAQDELNRRTPRRSSYDILARHRFSASAARSMRHAD
jgi:hypothetical protein